MSENQKVNRRGFLGSSLATVGVAGAVSGSIAARTAASAAQPAGSPDPQPVTNEPMPYGMIGKAKISRLLLGGNLVSGYMHARDLKYVNQLFRAYVSEDKMMETLRLAEANGINTVFETGANFVQRYNREFGGKMQFIPHVRVDLGQDEPSLKTHIQHQVDSGAVALYIWGVAADRLIQAGAVSQLAKAVELAKRHDLPVGVGSHSLLVPMQCEQHQVPCDFYVKTLHSDDYPSATPKPQRKEFIWLDGGPGWYDNMWCIDPEETIEFMRTVTKPWLAFKVLAAGAFYPKQAFPYAFRSGADFIAVGMFDFHIKDNAELVSRVVRREQDRQRPWCA
jgi:hypothetical protein